MLDLMKRIVIALSIALFIGILFLGTNQTAKADSPFIEKWQESFVWPTIGEITDTYGSRGGRHFGLDIAAPEGTPVISIEEGVVTKSYYSDSYGNVVFIKHEESDIETVYAHLHQRDVEEGQIVQAKQLIGTVGNTGRSHGNHLHFEMHQGEWNIEKSASIDPLIFLSNEPSSLYAALDYMDDQAIQTMSRYIDEDLLEEEREVEDEKENLEIELEKEDYTDAMAMVEETVASVLEKINAQLEELKTEKNEGVSKTASESQSANLGMEREASVLTDDEQTTSEPLQFTHEIVIEKDDTLWAIATKYHVSVEEIKEWNERTSDLLQIGETIIVHEQLEEEPSHIVKQGENLYQLAKEYHLSVSDLKEFNQLEGDVIHPGLKLLLHGGKF
ncbi:peptidase M23 [Alkalihalobacillus alcalophilus ATCC 27647 = CGMCC 1.3604]|uniref:Peptidase M23 n=1 Tax=Alkalihalobacillus alcalophilus ATCC 27647 = CGMCC 1.3604 TaxID=1218173 RepID=A0A4S4K411_ALKAL|nr:M23 family metallopeptidase [Alkalihalobacillus alcalophilus]MED1560382.1 peptidoglycan DD-metalloendopeptidase family protein [Alkalihalobacillus alcalophilus]THG90799.1 peptidase M23 [Alkalihalobacillus alcalophilus ATCC 27647 = CGMCC 1.3604]